MAKREIPKDYDPLKDLENRINQFIEVNKIALTKGELSAREEHMIMGQQIAFQSVTTLIRMIRKKGSIWKGGYLDSTGVIYTDQVQDIIDGKALPGYVKP